MAFRTLFHHKRKGVCTLDIVIVRHISPKEPKISATNPVAHTPKIIGKVWTNTINLSFYS